MADATNIKNLIINAGNGTYQFSGGEDICSELGISKERFAELLARDFYCPVLQYEPTASTLTYTDTDGSVNHFAIGQECRVPDVESQDYRVYKFMGTYQGNAVWVKLPQKISDLENDAGFYSGANVQAVDAGMEIDEPDVRYLTTKPQILTEEERATVKGNLGITDVDIDLSGYATKEDLAGYATEEDLTDYATKEDLKQKPNAYPLLDHGVSDTEYSLTPNVFHVWGEVEMLDLSFEEEMAGISNEYLFQFTSGGNATTLMLPDSVKWANGAVISVEPNMTYQVSILRGFASVMSFVNG